MIPISAILLLGAFGPQQQNAPATDATPRMTQKQSGLVTFHVTTREVIVDVIAVNSRNGPVPDLSPVDLQVFDVDSEAAAGYKRRPILDRHPPSNPISSLRWIDATGNESGAAEAQQTALRISASCLEHATPYYQLAYHPDARGMTPGYHNVLITTTRRGVHLYYRHRYYVGNTAPLAANLPDVLAAPRLAQLDAQLRQAACYRADVPDSLSLAASLIDNGRTDVLRYSVTVDTDSLGFISLSDTGRRVQLDYAVCNFDTSGQGVDYWHASIDKTLSPLEYARAQAHGFPHILEFPMPPHLGISRIVVRDLVTGNIGSVNVVYPLIQNEPKDAASQATAENARRSEAIREAIRNYGPLTAPPPGPIGSFGSIVPSPNSFCGDVYELPGQTKKLPDFRELNPVGSIYTTFLGVPDQLFTPTNGIPGVTSRLAWFGIDYYGTFWIRNSGAYEFRLSSDDGAMVQIDDRQLIDLDGLHMARTKSSRLQLDAGLHTVHVPYFQGKPDAVALGLWIREPGRDWKIFDLRDFAPPR
jgi:hypothetical protein